MTLVEEEAVKQAVNYNLPKEVLKSLSDEIVSKVTANIIEYFDDNKRADGVEEEEVWVWSEDNKEFFCKPCLLYSKDKDRPSHLDKYYKAKFGHFTFRSLEDRSKNKIL